MKRRECLKLLGGAAVASLTRTDGAILPADEEAPDTAAGFGLAAITFGPPGRENGIEFRRFLRAGAFAEITPTNATAWWDAKLLHVEFRNTEPDPLYRGNPGLAKPVHYPGNARFEISAYPDAVYVQYRPNWTDVQVSLFAVDSSGARNREDIDADVQRQPGQWTAHFQIPWVVLGGRPAATSFGLNIVRSRGQSSEVLSPVVLDQTLKLPPDLLMYARFGETSGVWSAPGIFIEVPDGPRRWQLPAHLISPGEQERRALWQAQQELDRATDAPRLPERVRLAQRLQDTLVLEGFSFHTDGSNWPVGQGEFYPHEARIAVNRALSNRDLPGACRVLDTYLHQLDRVIRRWFADESPGNIRTSEWTRVTSIGSLRREGDEVHFDGIAGKYRCGFRLSFSNGAMRLRNEHAGIFEPAPPEMLRLEKQAISSGEIQVRVEERPWRIVVLDNSGRKRWSIGHDDLSLRFSPSGDVLAIDLHRDLSPGENFYGFGERFNALGQRGNIVTLWDVDCWDGNIHGQLNQAYKNVPLVHSTAGYSLFWNTTYRVRADIGNAEPDRYRITAFGDIFDIFLWPASPERALRSYTALTGTPILPPTWAFEPWMGGGGRRWSNGPFRNAVKEELHVVDRFRELDIPHSAIYAEAGNADPNLYANLKGTNLHVLAWVWASMDIDRVRELLPGLPDARLPVLRCADGRIAYRSEKNAIIDYTHPLAPDLLRRFWKPRFDLGLAGSMVDFGDMVPDDAVFYNRKRGVEMHNFYAHPYHQVYSTVFQQQRGQDYVLFARSGCAGDQHSICHFAGDHQANFFGMRAALRGGLNAASCGFSNWGADAGGYAGWPDPEVYIRWTEWATFCPLMRFHGTTPREPWEYGDEAIAIYKRYAWLRENLLLYIERSAQEAHKSGIPLIRPMPFAFPDSPDLANCDDQYLFGPDLLIAPMLGPGESRAVLLPPGVWTCLWTAASYDGESSIRIATPIDRIGVFLRAGACLPLELAPSLAPGDSMSAGRVKAILATKPAAGTFRAKTDGAKYLLVYGYGTKRVVTLDPGVPFLTLPVATAPHSTP